MTRHIGGKQVYNIKHANGMCHMVALMMNLDGHECIIKKTLSI